MILGSRIASQPAKTFRLGLAALVTGALLAFSTCLVGGCGYLGPKGPDSKFEMDLKIGGVSEPTPAVFRSPPADRLQDASSWSDVGLQYEHASEYDGALASFKKAAELSPNTRFYWVSYGKNAQRLSRFKEAVEAYQKALALDSTSVVITGDLGQCYQMLRQDVDARKYYLRALSLLQSHLEGWEGLSVVVHRLNEFKYFAATDKLKAVPTEQINLHLANDMNENFLQSHPDDYLSLVNRGTFKLKLMELDAARIAFKDALKVKPDGTEAQIGLAQSYATVGDDAPAAEILKDVIDKSPFQSVAWYELARIKKRQGDLRKALDCMGRATALSPERASWTDMFQIWLTESRQSDKT